MKQENYKVKWSSDGSLAKSQESNVIHHLGEAQDLARTLIPYNRSVNILKEDGFPLNKGKFFLYLIMH